MFYGMKKAMNHPVQQNLWQQKAARLLAYCTQDVAYMKLPIWKYVFPSDLHESLFGHNMVNCLKITMPQQNGNIWRHEDGHPIGNSEERASHILAYRTPGGVVAMKFFLIIHH